MSIKRREFLAGSAAVVAIAGAPAIVRGQAAAIKIGEINSYTTQTAFLNPYRNGWTMALEEVNAAGGFQGRKLETIFRGDAGKPQGAVRPPGGPPNNEK